MSDSSDELNAVLGKVDTKKICQLLLVLSSREIRSVELVERRYSDGARNFAETLSFLHQISWVSNIDGALHLTPAAASAVGEISDEKGIRTRILDAAIADASPYGGVVAGYVRSFELEGSLLVRRPSLSERSRERPIRDFLMDLRRVGYRQGDDSHVLDETAAPLYVWAVNRGRITSMSKFDQLQHRRMELGYAAELVVFEYEKVRLGSSFAGQIEHMSADSPFSSYDILSATVDENGVHERYIEVKAVDPASMRFFWSRSEIDIATILGCRYFLYLLPYSQRGGFDINALAIYCDPVRTLLSDTAEWQVEEDAVVCQKRNRPSFSVSSED